MYSKLSRFTIDWDLYYSKLIIKQKPINKNNDENRSLISQGSKIINHFIWDHNQFAAHQFNIGSEFYQQQQQSNKLADRFPAATLRNIPVWLEDEIRLNKLPITFSIGTRYSNYRNDSDRYTSNQDSQWTSRGAVSFTPTHWLEIFSSYAEGYRAPTLNEIYNDSKHFAMNYFTSNPNLQPERNQTIEYGVNLQFDNMSLANNSLQWRTAIFDTKATNYIKTEVHGFPPIGKTLSINTPSVVIHGIDSRINYTTPWFNAVLAYNRTHAKDTTSGMSISSIRPESLTASLDVPLANSCFSLGWVGQFAARTNRSGDHRGKDKYWNPITQQTGYGTNDFYLYYQGNGRLSGINSTLSLTNAFNKSYTSSLGIPQEGRNIHFKINYRW